MLAFFQAEGSTPFSYDWIKILVSIGAISAESSFRIRHGIASGPQAFLASIPARSLATPFSSIDSGVIDGCDGPLSFGIFDLSSLVKTDLNCLLSISALLV